MRPGLLLALWRDRWRKPGTAGLHLPLSYGRIADWSRRLAATGLFSSWSALLPVAAVCAGLFGMAISIRFSLYDQVVVSGLLLMVALMLRRTGGTVITLVLAALALLASLRYLSWRYAETLGPAGGLEYALGAALFAAELYFVLMWALEYLRSAFPYRHGPVALAAAQPGRPSIDIFILGYEHTVEELAEAVRQAGTLHFPSGRLTLHVVDTGFRPEAANACASRANYTAPAEGKTSPMTALLDAVRKTKGDLLIVLDSCGPLESEWLATAAAWFAASPRLGMITTPHHMLAPAPTRTAIRMVAAAETRVRWACLRRKALLSALGSGRIDPQQADSCALALQDGEYRVSYLDLDASTQPADIDDRSTGPATTVLYRIDQPFSPISLRFRRAVIFLNEVAQFYATLPRILFLIAPAMYFLLGAPLVRAEAEWLAAFAFPHLLHIYLFHTRVRQDGPLPLGTELRERLLACYLLLPAAVNLAWTHVTAAIRRARGRDSNIEPLARTYHLLPFATICAVNLAGLAGGLLQLQFGPADLDDLRLVFLGWCVVNLLLLASMLALTGEANQIRRHLRDRAALPAMVRLAYGRTISCTTTNFPDPELTLELPSSVEIKANAVLTVSLLLDARDYPFPARIVSHSGCTLQVRIDDAAQADYARLAQAALSRGADWPAWLPGRQADRLESMGHGLLDFLMHIGSSMKAARTFTRTLFRTRTDE